MFSPRIDEGQRVKRMSIKKIFISEVALKTGITEINVLTFRPLGKEVKNELIDQINLCPTQCVIDLDFTGNEICDVSFVDEIVLEVQLYLMKNTLDRIILISNISDATLENLDAAIAVRDQRGIKLQVLKRDEDQISYIGKLERNLDVTLKQLLEKKEITAREIAVLNGIAINSASNRLKKLYDNRLVLRKEYIDTLGKQHIYFLP